MEQRRGEEWKLAKSYWLTFGACSVMDTLRIVPVLFSLCLAHCPNEN